MQRSGSAAGAGLAALLLLASACSTLGPIGQKTAFEDTQRRYVRLIRWGEYEAASAFVQEEAREEFLDQIPALSNVRFTSYQIVDSQFDGAHDEATVIVSYQAYHLNRLIEHGWSERQTWERGEDGEWRVAPDLEGLRQALAKMEPR